MLSGKHYSRALRVHRIIVEALELMLLAQYLQGNPIKDRSVQLLDFASDPLHEKLNNTKCQDVFQHNEDNRDSVMDYMGRQPKFGSRLYRHRLDILHFIAATNPRGFKMRIALPYPYGVVKGD